MGRTPRQTVHLRLPTELVRRAREQARLERRTFTALVEVALERYLEGVVPVPIRYYIPGTFDGRPHYLILEGEMAALLPAEKVEPDPCSRIIRPPLKPDWVHRLRLTDEERGSFEASPVAYTRVWFRP